MAAHVCGIVDAGKTVYLIAALGELMSVSLVDVKNWFDHNNIYDSDNQATQSTTARPVRCAR